jgi:hypothetical protein
MISKSGKGRAAKYFYTNSETKECYEIDVYTYYTIRNFLKRYNGQYEENQIAN